MTWHSHADPPRTLTRRLENLNGNLQSLHQRVKESIAGAISAAVAEAIRDVVSDLLGVPIRSNQQPGFNSDARQTYQHQQHRDRFDAEERNDWQEDYDPEQNLWQDNDHYEHGRALPVPINPQQQPQEETCTPWHNALGAAFKAGLWWLQKQKSRRPVLTTTLVALAAGVTALIAGPVLPASLSVLASVGSIVLTADSARTTGDLLSAATIR
jgi:hypothetical protein